ncbi:hypothetical protein U0070_019276 [Myodes glareolus]|uniref:Small ribosomal subunit protein uS17m n=1 Tax=Myodes glareolus TaxID=447135 RepID=A0AAW0IWI8_MYOGA
MRWVVGKVIGTAMVKTANVRATRLVLDPCLLKYFNKQRTHFARDAHQQCCIGDTVCLRALPVTGSKHVTHELAEIIFKVGQVIDPVTGKPCVGFAYLESPLSSETANPITLFNDRIRFLGITGLSLGASGLFSIDSQSTVDSCFLSESTGEKPNFLKNFSTDYVISRRPGPTVSPACKALLRPAPWGTHLADYLNIPKVRGGEARLARVRREAAHFMAHRDVEPRDLQALPSFVSWGQQGRKADRTAKAN